jgi:hypothetical protein
MLDNYSTHASETVPFATEFILISRQEEIQLKADLNRYKNLHQRALLKINHYGLKSIV